MRLNAFMATMRYNASSVHGSNQDKVGNGSLRGAFTLVELLVVIAIIAMMASLLLPAVSLVRYNAMKATCGGNQRQIFMGVVAYAQDWKGKIPYTNIQNYTRCNCYSSTGYAYSEGVDAFRFDWWGIGKLIGVGILDTSRVTQCPDYNTPSGTAWSFSDPYKDRIWRLPAMYNQIIAGGYTSITGSYVLNSYPYEAGPGRGRMGSPGANGAFWSPDTASDPQGYGPVKSITSLIMCRSYGKRWEECEFQIGLAAHQSRGVNCTYIDGHVRWIPLGKNDYPTRWTEASCSSIYRYGSSITYSGFGFWSYATFLDQ